MVFLFIMLLIISTMMFGFMQRSRQQHGSYRTPLVLFVVLLVATVWAGFQVPKTFQRIADKKAQQKAFNKLPVSQRQALQKQFQNDVTQKDDLSLSSEQRKQTLTQQELAVAKQLDATYQKIGDVTFDTKTKSFQLRLYADSNLAKAIAQVEQQTDLAEQISWSTFTGSLVKTSQSIQKLLNSGYTFSLMGVDNPTKVIFAAKDGRIITDISQ
jgi:hypothetical protein